MNADKKRAAILAGVFLAIVVWLLWPRDKGRVIQGAGGDVNLGDVSMFVPGLAPIRTGELLTMPTFDTSPLEVDMQGSCCMDCAQARPPAYVPASNPARTMLIFNEGQKGNNVYNYAAPPAPTRFPNFQVIGVTVNRGTIAGTYNYGRAFG